MNRAIQLAIEIASRASTAGIDATATAATVMRDKVVSAADGAAGGLDRVSSAADTMDDRAGRATGALGALGSGFALVGAEKYAGALEAAAMATDFFSGVGQAMNLILELESFQRVKAAAAAGAHAAATTVQAGAAKAAAVGQWALNAAMAANPVALVVLAVVALVAVFVLAYKKSETFRNVVDGAMAGARTAIGWVVDKVSDLVGWVVEKAAPSWAILRDAVTVALAVVREKFGPVLETATRIFTSVRDTITSTLEAARSKVEDFKNKAVGFFELLMTPINAVKDAIGWIVDKLANLSFPKAPSWLGGGGDAYSSRLATPAAGGPVSIAITVTPTPGIPVDPTALGVQLAGTVNDALVRLGYGSVVV